MAGEIITLPSYAKINWFLRVGGIRDDGYHEICTVFQTVSLRDRLIFEESDTLSLECDDDALSTGPDNLILKVAARLREAVGGTKGARIRLEKRIPFPGGLGGGSSNAAMTLLGLAALWDIDPAQCDLRAIASELGSDVPFFLTGGTALGTGTGTRLSSLADPGEKLLVIVTPDEEVSTDSAYRSLSRSALTKNESKSILSVCLKDAERLISGGLRLFNDFEEAVFQLVPKTAAVHRLLLDNGAASALLSGSGASVFGVFDNDVSRQRALDVFERTEGCRVFSAESVSSERYREALKPVEHLIPEIPN